MRVVGIRFVDVLGRSDGREHEARHGYKSNSRAPRRTHDAVDYGSSDEAPSNTPPAVRTGVVRARFRSHASGRLQRRRGVGVTGFSVSRMKRVPDAELEAGTLDRADFGFREQTAAMSETDQRVEATFRSRIVRESEDVEGRTTTHVQVPH